jgi:hypothetical protein
MFGACGVGVGILMTAMNGSDGHYFLWSLLGFAVMTLIARVFFKLGQ